MNVQLKSMKFIEGFLLFLTIALAVVGVFTIFTYSAGTKTTNKSNNIPPKNNTYSVKAIKSPSSASFAGEYLPLENFDVRESLDKEIHKVCFWHSETFLYIKRANRFFPVIEQILRKNNVPDDFKYLALAESGLENVTSPAGAKGYWQILKGTGKKYNLEINSEVDERYHIEKSTQAACNYLKRVHRKYGNWTMAAAAYNLGEGNLDKQIAKQHQTSYYDLLLNSETARYVYRTTAIKLILEDPEYYGFYIDSEDLYKPFEYNIVILDSTVTNFAVYAEKNKINYKTLKILNPWLRDNKLTNSGKKYEIKIPKNNMRSTLYE